MVLIVSYFVCYLFTLTCIDISDLECTKKITTCPLVPFNSNWSFLLAWKITWPLSYSLVVMINYPIRQCLIDWLILFLFYFKYLSLQKDQKKAKLNENHQKRNQMVIIINYNLCHFVLLTQLHTCMCAHLTSSLL